MNTDLIRVNRQNPWLKMSFQKYLTQRVFDQVANIVNLLSANESLLHDTVQRITIIRSDFVTMLESCGVNGELIVGVPDYDISVIANGDRSLARLERNLLRWIRAEPTRHIQKRKPAASRLRPNHRQSQLQ